ncbi:FAD dependent oxidoreductase [Bisporella sp. PMI_857]|nr:FAD dependent oxidoreductase [Bisporella sp. PMI_857]
MATSPPKPELNLNRQPILPHVGDTTKPFWHEELHELHDHRSSEALPESTDILIIGAGFAGVATAHHLVEAESSGEASKLSITILEARGVCSGATGRNGGHVRPDLYGHIPTYIKRYGVEAGEEWAKYEIANLKALKKFISEDEVDCDFVLTRTCNAYTNQKGADAAKAVYDSMKGLGYMEDVDWTNGEAAEGVSGVKGAKACATYTAATLWPYKFIIHLLKKALGTGRVHLQTQIPVTKVTQLPAGDFVVETPRGSMRAKKVIHANNGYVSGLIPEYSASIVPCKGICSRISVPKTASLAAPLVTNSYIIYTPDGFGLDYLIPRHDGSIIVGGASHTFRPFKEQWFNNVDDGVLIEAAKDYYDGYMQRTFRGWDNSGAKVDKIWTGVMGYSWDSLPHVGDVPGRPGQIIIAGFNGHGMPIIWLAAKGVAEMIIKDKPFDDVGLPHIMKTSAERLQKAKNGPEGGDIFGAAH